MTTKPSALYVRKLSNADVRVLAYIRAFWSQHGFGPAVREVASGAGVVLPVAHSIIHRLYIEGYVEKVPRLIRTLRLANAPPPGAPESVHRYYTTERRNDAAIPADTGPVPE